MSTIQIALQLYTLRDLLDADAPGTLRRVRDIGYTRVELAGLGKYSARAYRAMLDDAGLTPISTHCSIERLETDLSSAIDDAKALGVKHLVCPYLPEERRGGESAWKAFAESLNRIGQTCHEQGIQFSYHHHSFEFVKVGGRYAFDLLFDETDPRYVCCELDTYWIQHGGESPVAYIEKLSGRCPLLHLKDMAADALRAFAPVGTGILDFKRILDAGHRAGAEYGVVEQDTCAGDPLDAIRISLENLNKLR